MTSLNQGSYEDVNALDEALLAPQKLDPDVAMLMHAGMRKQDAEALISRSNAKKFYPNVANTDLYKGGSGSGNFGHSGRAGEVGGSVSGGLNALTATRATVKPNPKMSEQELLDRIKGTYGQTAEKPKTDMQRLASMRVIPTPGGDYKGSQTEIYKTPGGVTVNIPRGILMHDDSDPISDESKLKLLDTAEDLHTRFGQPTAINVITADTMRDMAGTYPWAEAPFGVSRLGGIDPLGREVPMMINADVMAPNELFEQSAKGGFMPSAVGADPMVYTVTHETGHMVDSAEVGRSGDRLMSPKATVDALVDIKAGSVYGRQSQESTGPEGTIAEAFAESFAEYVLTKGQTTDPLSQALAKSEGWVGK